MSYMHGYGMVDTGVSRIAIEQNLVERGYWLSARSRENRSFVLSPSLYKFSATEAADLQRLGQSTYAAVQSLNTRLCNLAAGENHLSHEDAWFLKLANVASRSLLRPCDGCTSIPPVLKVDLVQDAHGKFFIAEVDAYNPRALGFAALLEGVPTAQGLRLWGMDGLLPLLYQCKRDGMWVIVVSEFERFYEPAFQMLAAALNARGVQTIVRRDVEILRAIHDGTQVLMIPDTLDQYPEVRKLLLSRERSGELTCLFPPVAYLGSKAFLPYLRTCTGMDEFVPRTALVGKRCGDPSALVDLSWPTVLKAAVSSGLKKVFFSDLDPEKYQASLAEARQLKNGCWVLQQQVPQQARPVTVFDEDGSRTTRNYFLRFTALVSALGTLDVVITGCEDRKVHGGVHCIMLPTAVG